MTSNLKSRICALALGSVAFHYAIMAIPSELERQEKKASLHKTLRRVSETPADQRLLSNTTSKKEEMPTFPPTLFPIYPCNCTCKLVYESGEPQDVIGHAMYTLDVEVIQQMNGDTSICVPKRYSWLMLQEATAICDETCL
jgi:hypothetical protein